jgi:hypothetical protein
MTFATVWALDERCPTSRKHDVRRTGPEMARHVARLHRFNKAAEPNTLVVRMGFDERDALIADDPAAVFEGSLRQLRRRSRSVIEGFKSRDGRSAAEPRGAVSRLAAGRGNVREKSDAYFASRRNGRPE